MFPSQKRLFPRVLGTLLFNNDNGLRVFFAFVPNVPKIFCRYPEQRGAAWSWLGAHVMRHRHDWWQATRPTGTAKGEGGSANFFSLRRETERPVLFLHAQVSVGGVPALGHYFPWERGNTSFLHQEKCFRGLILLAFMLPSYLGTNWEHYGNKLGTNTNIFIT